MNEQSELAQAIRELREEIGGLRGDIVGLRSNIGGLHSEVGELRGNIVGLQVEVGGLRGEMTKNTQALSDQSNGLRGLTAALVDKGAEPGQLRRRATG